MSNAYSEQMTSCIDFDMTSYFQQFMLQHLRYLDHKVSLGLTNFELLNATDTNIRV